MSLTADHSELPRPSAGDIAGKVAVVTGASRGLGAAIARRLASDGAHVILAARSSDDLDAVVKDIRASGGSAQRVLVDLSDPLSIARLQDVIQAEHSKVDILVNNAGILPPPHRIEKTELASWCLAIDVNLTAPFLMSAWVVGRMAEGGVLVNILSPAGFYPSVGLSGYNVSKAGLSMFTRAAALEFARRSIRVVGVIPGKVDTELAAPILQYLSDRGLPLNPMRRTGRLEEVADAVSFLVSDRASFITGALMPVDGGELTGLPPVY